jgi:hypothetical protein
MADAVMEGKAIRNKEAEEEELEEQVRPAEVSRFVEEEEFEDEDLLGESTLKYLGTSAKAKVKKELDDEVEEELEDDVEESDD